MSKKNVELISILTIQSQDVTEERAMFPSPTRILARSTEVAAETFRDSLSGFVKMLGTVVQGVPELCGGYRVDTLTFSLDVNGSGKISLVGELSAGITSGITVTLKKERALP